MRKYQFYISFNEKANTAASKAIVDCKQILSEAGYRDFTVLTSLSDSKKYLLAIFSSLSKLAILLKPRSIVAVQYPLLSGNGFFKYFIKMMHLKKIKFFCVIHDLDELRYKNGSVSNAKIEAGNLNCYDCIIVHNEIMKQWLIKGGVTANMISLNVFDYITDEKNTALKPLSKGKLSTIVFAGNLSKSNFIYSLGLLNNWQFNLYGPNFLADKGYSIHNVNWHGSYSTSKIANKIKGDFGLIWDGEYIDRLDEQYGNYLKYNNPHKLSLYIAAGLPIIAPVNSAIAGFIKENQIGVLVESLFDLKELLVNESEYNQLQLNVHRLGKRVKQGHFFSEAVSQAERLLFDN